MTTTAVTRETTGWTVTDDTFAARLALVRLRMGWNVKEAAREVGEPAASWRLWEMGGAIPRRQVEIAKKISTRTGCDYLWLLLDPEDRPSGGDGGSTRQYFQPARTIATGGEDRRRSGRYPVARTQPRLDAIRSLARPLTPAAV